MNEDLKAFLLFFLVFGGFAILLHVTREPLPEGCLNWVTETDYGMDGADSYTYCEQWAVTP